MRVAAIGFVTGDRLVFGVEQVLDPAVKFQIFRHRDGSSHRCNCKSINARASAETISAIADDAQGRAQYDGIKCIPVHGHIEAMHRPTEESAVVGDIFLPPFAVGIAVIGGKRQPVTGSQLDFGLDTLGARTGDVVVAISR